MRIAVTTDDKINTSYPLDRAKGFMIYDIENGDIINQFYRSVYSPEYSDDSNRNILESEKKNLFQEALKDCSTVITNCMGIINKDLYNKIDIEIFQTTEINVDNAIEQYLHNNIKVVELDQ